MENRQQQPPIIIMDSKDRNLEKYYEYKHRDARMKDKFQNLIGIILFLVGAFAFFPEADKIPAQVSPRPSEPSHEKVYKYSQPRTNPKAVSTPPVFEEIPKVEELETQISEDDVINQDILDETPEEDNLSIEDYKEHNVF